MKSPITPERDVQRSIIDYFAAVYRIQLHRRNTGAQVSEYKGKKRLIRFSAPGQADLWGIEPKTGRAIECEVKRLNGQLTEHQATWLEECRSLGAIAFMANSLDMAIAEYERQRRKPASEIIALMPVK